MIALQLENARLPGAFYFQASFLIIWTVGVIVAFGYCEDQIPVTYVLMPSTQQCNNPQQMQQMLTDWVEFFHLQSTYIL